MQPFLKNIFLKNFTVGVPTVIPWCCGNKSSTHEDVCSIPGLTQSGVAVSCGVVCKFGSDPHMAVAVV